MDNQVRKVSTRRFVLVAELLDHAFPKAQATPDYLSHHCERAEHALLDHIGKSAFTTDERLAELLTLTHRP